MAKRRKKKKLLRFCLLLIVLILFVGGGYWFYMDYNSNRSKLERIGYNESEITLLLENKTNLDYALVNDYDELFISFITADNYDSKNLEDYLDYKKDNVTAPIDDVIYLVNNNIKKVYSKTLMSLIGYDYFVEDYLDRYLNYVDEYPNKSIKEVVTNVNSNIDYPFYTEVKSVDISKGNLMLVNKYNQLSKTYKNNMVTMSAAYSNVTGAQLTSDTYESFKRLVDDAKKLGYYIANVSAYRSYDTQNYIYNDYKNKNGLVWADSYSARPGHSEHQTGLALDVGANGGSLGTFENSKEFPWMRDNAHKYGFILRYPKGKEYITGYNYEPWHYRYVGVEVATDIYNKNITFEEYYAFFVK